MSDAVKQCTPVVVYEAPTIRVATSVVRIAYSLTVRLVLRILTLSESRGSGKGIEE